MTIQAPINPRSGNPIKERIGIYGPPKIGKTHIFLTIALWHMKMGSDAKFYAISTDMSYEVLTMNEEFLELDNIEWTDAATFEEYMQAARKYTKKMRAHDWLSGDLQSAAWGFVQDEYAKVQTKKAGGNLEDMGDLWATTGGGEAYPIEGWEWGMPNARYRILANNLLLRAPGHLFLVYGQKELVKESGSAKTAEDPKVKEMFGHINLKPDGQKDDPFRWHTLIHVDSAGHHKQKMATAGERWGGRKELGRRMSNGMLKDADVEDFFMEYLVEVAGWTM